MPFIEAAPSRSEYWECTCRCEKSGIRKNVEVKRSIRIKNKKQLDLKRFSSPRIIHDPDLFGGFQQYENRACCIGRKIRHLRSIFANVNECITHAN